MHSAVKIDFFVVGITFFYINALECDRGSALARAIPSSQCFVVVDVEKGFGRF
jgi:hypothetical protein